MAGFGPRNPSGWSRFKPGFHFPAGKFQTDPSRPVSTNIRPSAKKAKSQKADFCLIGGYLFMGPSWVGALVLIFGQVYIVWVCAPRYKPLSCCKNRIREKRTSNFGPNFATLDGFLAGFRGGWRPTKRGGLGGAEPPQLMSKRLCLIPPAPQ